MLDQPGSDDDILLMEAIEARIRWLSAWMIHEANHVRPNMDGLKVGGHQASCASVTAILTALYCGALGPNDRVAVKPHASPAFHALHYLLGLQSLDKLKNFRALGGAQSYPSRTKDGAIVDFSTGSVGLGAATANFAALTQDFLMSRGLLAERDAGRMVAIVGDAELDEGNVYEALLDGWKQDLRNVWWVIDYNRQSLDGVVNEHLFRIIGRLFRAVGWNVITVKYGRQQMAAFETPGGDALRRWINACPNDIYSALCFQGGAAWRAQITADAGGDAGLTGLLDRHDDAALNRLMTNLGGHDISTLLDAFASVTDDRPTCFIAYTVKGWGLPLAGHKDNHAGLMSPVQMEGFRESLGIAPGQEWEPFAGLDIPEARLRHFLDDLPFRDGRVARHAAPVLPVPASLPFKAPERASTQEAFGRLLNDIARAGGALADRIVTVSPDVTVSTNLGAWVNQRGLFARRERADVFRDRSVPSAQRWARHPSGQHVELGIAENDLFLALGALGLSAELFGQRLLPLGTLYDPFIARGLDALNHACYQDARFILVATPSGVTLAPEGGAHQSVATPLIGMGQPGLSAFEPAFADELAVILRWAFAHIQEPEGGSVYLRLSTRPLDQPRRPMTPALESAITDGAYWAEPPAPGAAIAVAYAGALAPEAREGWERIAADHPGAGLLAITSADRLYQDWFEGGGVLETLLAPLASGARIVTLVDGHPAALSWIGGVRGHRIIPLGVISFGQSADLPRLYKLMGLDADAVVRAAGAG